MVRMPAARAFPEPPAMATGFPLRPSALAGTVAVSVTLPGAAVVTLMARPLLSAARVTFVGTVAVREAGAFVGGAVGGGVVVPPPVPVPGPGGGAVGGRNVATL